MPNWPPIPEAQLIKIRQSVMEAVRRSGFMDASAARRARHLQSKSGYTLEHADADEFIEQLVFSPRPPLSDARAIEIIASAANRNDTRFFVRLGKALSQRPKEPTRTLWIPPFQIQFLIGNWADASEMYPELCRLTPEGLLAVLQHKFGPDNVKADVAGLVKQRQRLGLIPLRRPKIHVILVGNKLKYMD